MWEEFKNQANKIKYEIEGNFIDKGRKQTTMTRQSKQDKTRHALTTRQIGQTIHKQASKT